MANALLALGSVKTSAVVLYCDHHIRFIDLEGDVHRSGCGVFDTVLQAFLQDAINVDLGDSLQVVPVLILVLVKYIIDPDRFTGIFKKVIDRTDEIIEFLVRRIAEFV